MDSGFANFSCDFAENVQCSCKERIYQGDELRKAVSKLTPNMVWSIDLEGRFNFLSGDTSNIFGDNSDIAIGKSVSDYFVSKDGAPLNQLLKVLFRSPREIRDLLLKRKGSEQTISISLTPHLGPNSELMGFRGMAQNISKYLEIEDQIKESNEALKNKNIALNELLSRFESERNEIYGTIATNIEKYIKPLLRTLNSGDNLTPIQKKTIATIEQHLNELNWSFYKNDEGLELPLTPTERQLCRLIKANYSVKEIAELQSISIETAKTHFKNIRKKLGLTNRKVRLASFFQQG